MLAILAAVKKWHSYLIGRHFHIKIDHYSLNFLLDQKATTPTQQAWIVKMMGYDYQVFFRKGSTNKVADALSKVPQASLYALSSITSDLFKRTTHSWLTDSSLVHLIYQLQANLAKPSKFSWKDS